MTLTDRLLLKIAYHYDDTSEAYMTENMDERLLLYLLEDRGLARSFYSSERPVWRVKVTLTEAGLQRARELRSKNLNKSEHLS